MFFWGLTTFWFSLPLEKLSRLARDNFYMSFRTRNKLLGPFSAVYEIVLELSDKREDDQSYSFVSKAEQAPVVLGREADPASPCTAKEASTGEQIIKWRWLSKVCNYSKV